MSITFTKRKKTTAFSRDMLNDLLEIANTYGGTVRNTETAQGRSSYGLTSQASLDAKAPGMRKLSRRKRRNYVTAGKCVSIPVSEYKS